MSIDKFGLGGWWPRPGQAAAGALDHLPADQWPMLAARWLAAGFDSEPLRQLAQLQSGGTPARHRTDRRDRRRQVGWSAQEFPEQVHRRHEAAFTALDLMPKVLRSIGFDPAPADEAFRARCQGALDIVQRDLDATGYGRFRVRAHIGRGWPARVHPALPDGSYWGGGEGLTREMDGVTLLLCAAESVCDTIKEVHEIEWPACAAHDRAPGTSIWVGDEPVTLIKKVAWWRCTRERHPLTPVGQLAAQLVQTP